MWPLRKETAASSRRYAVLVRARNLVIADDEGRERVGGAYTWRSVVIVGPGQTIEGETKGAPVFRKEVRNSVDFPPDVFAEELYVLQEGTNGRDTAVISYIDTSEEQ